MGGSIEAHNEKKVKKSVKIFGFLRNFSYISTVIMSDMIGIKLIELKSVGSLLDPDTGCIYPQYGNTSGEPDLSCEISLYDDEVASDWYDMLSEEDYQLVKPYIQ